MSLVNIKEKSVFFDEADGGANNSKSIGVIPRIPVPMSYFMEIGTQLYDGVKAAENEDRAQDALKLFVQMSVAFGIVPLSEDDNKPTE